MPAGSHGGSPGGHSSGGASFGGGGRSFGGGSSWGGGHRHHRPARTRPYYFPMFGHTYVIGTTGYNRLMSLIGGTVMVAFAAIICLIMSFSQGSAIKKIEEDRNYYLDMIATAETEQIVNAEVISKFLGEGDKYFITFNIELSNGRKLWIDDAYSYSMYTLEEASAILREGTIEVVLEKPLANADGATDAIPTDYANFKLEDDGSYVSAKRTVTTMRVVAGVMAGVFVLLLVLSIRLAFSHKQTEEEAKVAQAPVEEQNKKTYCAYCGGVMTEGQDSCPRCGARMKK